MADFLKGYKTHIFNALALVVALAQHYGGPLPEVDETQFALAVTIGNILIRRYLTTGPDALAKKPE